MKITEIITESQELEEGWKQKLAGAALAGAAALGGGGSQAQPVDWYARDHATTNQQVVKPQSNAIPILLPGDLYALAEAVGTLDSLARSGLNVADEKNTYNRALSIFSYNLGRLNDREKPGVLARYNSFHDTFDKITKSKMRMAPVNKQMYVNVEVPEYVRKTDKILTQAILRAQQAQQPKPQPKPQAQQPQPKAEQQTLTFNNGAVYKGEVRDGKPNGFGTATNQGITYTGEYVNGARHGKGTITNSTNGTKYSGEWKNNVKHVGTQTYSDGSKYSGQWNNDKPNGKGTYTKADGSVVTGIWEDGKLIQKQ